LERKEKESEMRMVSESVKEIEARLNTLKHVKAFVEMNIKAREEELKQRKEGEQK